MSKAFVDSSDGELGSRGGALRRRRASNMIWLDLSISMGSNMKTTIDISDPLLDAAREEARRRATTVKALIEEGLRRVIADGASTKPFELRRCSFEGCGLRPEFDEASWDRLREMAYEGRGG